VTVEEDPLPDDLTTLCEGFWPHLELNVDAFIERDSKLIGPRSNWLDSIDMEEQDSDESMYEKKQTAYCLTLT